MTLYSDPGERPPPRRFDLGFTAGMTWVQYYAAYFERDGEDGMLYCLRCGTCVRDGWQVNHVEGLHTVRF
jgi:hypothetical protein